MSTLKLRTFPGARELFGLDAILDTTNDLYR